MVSTILLQVSVKLQAPYNASKAAVKHLAASLAVEWAAQGVRVNALRLSIPQKHSHRLIAQRRHSPGYMLTKLTKTILEKNIELKVGNVPMINGVFRG